MLKTIDIVLPCYNPNSNWHLELLDFYSSIKDQYDINFILVNDGSGPNGILAQLEHLKNKGVPVQYVFYTKNMGKGYALRQGVLQAKNKFIVYTDVDFPFTNQSMADVISSLVNENYDVVAGYRNQAYYQKTMSSFRKLLSKAFRFFIKNILKMSVSDTQCGLKGFNEKGKIKFLQTTINRYLFDFEFIYASGKDKNITVSTVPVQLKEGIVFSKMKTKILLQESFNLLRILLFKRS